MMHKALAVALIVVAACSHTLRKKTQPPAQSSATSSAADLSIVAKHFPQHDDMQVVCWSILEHVGPVSEIVVFQTDQEGRAWPLWRSALDSSYSPKIEFLPGATIEGLAVAFVERQTGAASSELDVIGKTKGRIGRLQHLEGFGFDLRPLGGAKLPSVIVHNDVNVLDVSEIYRWNGARFIIDSAAHPDFYRELLSKDQKELPSDSAAIVLVNLARIAVLSGDRAAAKQILDSALAAERGKGASADAETLRAITRALHELQPTTSNAPRSNRPTSALPQRGR